MLKVILIGIIAGIVSGLFSTGGGMILVPAFFYILKMSEKKARASAIACVLIMVITTSTFYAKSNYINLELGLKCAIGGIIGGYLGSKLLNKLPENILKITFIIFLLYIAINYIGG